MSNVNTDARFLLLDTETPGVDDFERDRIFEVAAIVTDRYFNELGRFETLVRPTPTSLLRLRSNPVVLEMHQRSGLYELLTGPDAAHLPTMQEAEKALLDFLADYLPEDESITIAGSGVARFDHPLLEVQMPALAGRLTYWEQDPSSARRLYFDVTGEHIVPPKAAKTHRAMADIEDDMRFLKAFVSLYRNAANPSLAIDPTTRELTAIALTEAFMGHDSFITADGHEVATTGTAEVVQRLLSGMAPMDLVGGYMSLAERLAHELAAATGTSVEALIGRARAEVLAGQ